ncbi:hypothetical protein RHGRI_010144 [Rhododendron griersonianum]|uniref:RING-type domain-containing protein n=1 Tax=Rhododendron griersonianum TaxID=479676 RepID=A0AAV6KI22_9ERIC|nr:hypothetical protein RHGRI_010144 [Rhododendron griersonianum]KAG5551945.1 hypothetical protein RHGRI_010144 [Rhododendron griersonianum]
MPAQKRYSSTSDNNLRDDDDDDDSQLQQHHSRRKQLRRERRAEDEEEEEEEEGRENEDVVKEDGDDDSGIIKKTRTVMECLHRFCRECIDKSMRLGNNECPACRKHCASRRSLRDDQRFDNLTEVLYEDIEKYEEEELAFHEEEKTRNKQIQASIAQVLQRQSEALVTKRKTGKERHSSSRLARAYSRRRHSRVTEHEGSEDNDEENNPDENKDSSSTDERGTEIKQRRCRRRAGGQLSQPSPSTANTEGGGIENDIEATKESKGTSSGPVWNPEMLAWGGAGARKKSVRNTRIMKLAKYLENLKENDDKLDVHLVLVSLDKQRMPSLQKLYLCCPQQFSVEHLKEYVALETQVRAEDIEILLMKNLSCNGLQSTLDTSNSMENKDVVQVLEGEDTLAVIRANCASNGNHLILAYRLKEKVHPETTPLVLS